MPKFKTTYLWRGHTRYRTKPKPTRPWGKRPPAPFFVALDDKDTGPVLHLKGKRLRAYWLAKSLAA